MYVKKVMQNIKALIYPFLSPRATVFCYTDFE